MARTTSSASVADRFAGCLLGSAVGDALGGPYEGLTSSDIYFQFGTHETIVANPTGETLYYTDDTEMMIGVAETLVDCGRVDEERLVCAFVEKLPPGSRVRAGRAEGSQCHDGG